MEHSRREFELTDDDFETEVHRSTLPLLVEFCAEWSGGCHIMAPILRSLAESLDGRMQVRQMNIDHCSRTANRFGVRTVPTLLLFRDGALVESVVGVVPRLELARRVLPNLDDAQDAAFDGSSTRVH